MKVLIVEDEEYRIKLLRQKLIGYGAVTITKTAQEAIKLIEFKNSFDMYFLDHDLGNRAFVSSSDLNTGYQVALHLKKLGSKGEGVIIHSLNAVGSQNIHEILPLSRKIPFPILMKLPFG